MELDRGTLDGIRIHVKFLYHYCGAAPLDVLGGYIAQDDIVTKEAHTRYAVENKQAETEELPGSVQTDHNDNHVTAEEEGFHPFMLPGGCE